MEARSASVYEALTHVSYSDNEKRQTVHSNRRHVQMFALGGEISRDRSGKN